MDKKSWSIIGIMLLAFWLSFIFLDGGLSMSSSGDAISLPHEEQKVLSYDIQNPVPSVQHFPPKNISSAGHKHHPKHGIQEPADTQ